MSYLSIAAAVIFTVAISQGIYVLRLDSASRTHRLFFLMSFALSVWLFGAMFAYSSPTREEVIFWFKLSSFGFIFLHAFTLHFCVELTGVMKIPRPLKILIYLPSLALYVWSLCGLIVYRDFIRMPGYWTGIPDFGGPSFSLLILQYMLYYISSFALLLVWRMRTGSRREKTQSAILMVSLVSTIFLFNLEPFILPLLTPYTSLALSPLLGIIWITGVWVAVAKYRLFSITPETVSADIIQNISSSIILLGPDMKVIIANPRTARLLGLSTADLRGRGLESIIVDYRTIAGTLESLGQGRLELFNRRLHFGAATGNKTMVDCCFTPIRDRYGDIIGILVIADEVLGFKQLQMRYRITDRESNVIHYILDGLSTLDIAQEMGITERTVKTHITNIYNKLNVNSRIRLLNLLKAYNLSPFETDKPAAEVESGRRLLKLVNGTGGI